MARGKTLYLSPLGQGQVQDDTLERPAFKKLVEAGDVEVLDNKDHPSQPGSGGGTASIPRSDRGHASSKGSARKGDR